MSALLSLNASLVSRAAQLTAVVGALRNAALLQLQGRFHSSSSKVTAAATETVCELKLRLHGH